MMPVAMVTGASRGVGRGIAIRSLVHNVPGGILDEMKNHSFQAITQELIVRVDEADFKRSWRVARQWDCRHQFSLGNRDCVEFLRAVGESLNLNMPRRGITHWTPQAYVRALLADTEKGSKPFLHTRGSEEQTSTLPVVFP